MLQICSWVICLLEKVCAGAETWVKVWVFWPSIEGFQGFPAAVLGCPGALGLW